jgi:hypothetical protein
VARKRAVCEEGELCMCGVATILIKLKFSQHILTKVSNIQFHQNPFSWSQAVVARRLMN